MSRFENLGIIKNKANYQPELLSLFETEITKMKAQKAWNKEQIVALFFKMIPDFSTTKKLANISIVKCGYHIIMKPQALIEFIRDTYKTNDFIPLHAPTFTGNEKNYVVETIDSTFVSSVGKFVDEFERKMEAFTGSTRAVATVNGTAALHTALYIQVFVPTI